MAWLFPMLSGNCAFITWIFKITAHKWLLHITQPSEWGQYSFSRGRKADQTTDSGWADHRDQGARSCGYREKVWIGTRVHLVPGIWSGGV